MCFCPEPEPPQPGWPPPASPPSAPPAQPSVRFQDDPHVRERLLPTPAGLVLPPPRLSTAYFRYDPIPRAMPLAPFAPGDAEVPVYPHQV